MAAHRQVHHKHHRHRHRHDRHPRCQLLLATATMCLAIVMFVSETLPCHATSFVRKPYMGSLGPNHVAIRWRTSVPTVCRLDYWPTAQGQAFGRIAFPDSEPTTEHVAYIADLFPDASYSYSVSGLFETITGGPSRAEFHTPPQTGHPHKKMRAWILADSGYSTDEQLAVQSGFNTYAASTGQPDFMVMNGDNAYDKATDEELQENLFDRFPMLSYTPLYVSIGNHEAMRSDSDTQSGPHFESFDMPKSGEAGGGFPSNHEGWYSFNWGAVHFIVLDSNFDRNKDPAEDAQEAWLVADLEEAQSYAHWLVVMLHHPPYTKGNHDSDVKPNEIRVREKFVPLFEAAGVDLVLSGHSHSYERSRLINGHYELSTEFDAAKHVVQPGDGSPSGDGAYEKPWGLTPNNGIVYVVSGGTSDLRDAVVELNHPVHVPIASGDGRNGFYGYGSFVLDVDGQDLDGRLVDTTGTVLDHFRIHKKDRTGAPSPLPTHTKLPNPSPSRTPSASPSSTRTPTPSPASSKTPSPTSSPLPSTSPTPTPSSSAEPPQPSLLPEQSPSSTRTRTPTRTPTPSETPAVHVDCSCACSNLVCCDPSNTIESAVVKFCLQQTAALQSTSDSPGFTSTSGFYVLLVGVVLLVGLIGYSGLVAFNYVPLPCAPKKANACGDDSDSDIEKGGTRSPMYEGGSRSHSSSKDKEKAPLPAPFRHRPMRGTEVHKSKKVEGSTYRHRASDAVAPSSSPSRKQRLSSTSNNASASKHTGHGPLSRTDSELKALSKERRRMLKGGDLDGRKSQGAASGSRPTGTDRGERGGKKLLPASTPPLSPGMGDGFEYGAGASASASGTPSKSKAGKANVGSKATAGGTSRKSRAAETDRPEGQLASPPSRRRRRSSRSSSRVPVGSSSSSLGPKKRSKRRAPQPAAV